MKNNIKIFKNDDEFILFAINTKPIFNTINNMTYFDFDYSNDYLDCIKNNIFFKIEDELSSIKKRKELNYRLIIKPIKNLT